LEVFRDLAFLRAAVYGERQNVRVVAGVGRMNPANLFDLILIVIIVAVKIDDCGPYFGGRIIDLSKAAARRPGITRRDGVALVRLNPVTAVAAYN
jgi:hypothetical protein